MTVRGWLWVGLAVLGAANLVVAAAWLNRDALAASGAMAVGLSGSGPTFFGIFPDAPAASKALGGTELRGIVTAAAGWAGTAETMASPEPG